MVFAEKGAYAHYRKFGGRYDLDELKSAAYLGLVKAARRFDPTRGFTFKTYAFTKIDRAMSGLHRLHLRQTGWRYDDGSGKGKMERLLRFTEWPTNEDGEEMEFPSVQDDDLDERLTRQRQRELVLDCAKNERERQILIGLLDGESLRQIGERCGLSYGRIQQLYRPLLARVIRSVRPKSTPFH